MMLQVITYTVMKGLLLVLLNNDLSTSTSGVKFIKNAEGSVNSAYLDTGKVLTIGVGHVVKQGEPHKITDEQAEHYLKADLREAETAVKNLVKVRLNQGQFDALVSFVFNVGCSAFKTSTLLKMLNAGNFESVANQFLRWNKDNGRVINGLTIRRQKESDLFKYGKYI